MTQFYAYLWLREDGTPYYAGKGCGRRAYQQDSHRMSPPKDPAKVMIFPMLNEAEAFESEIAMIDLFGRKDLGTGCLRNLTDGGEGVSNPSEETRRKKSLKSMGNKSFLGHKHPPEWSAKMSANQTGGNKPYRLGILHTEATKKQISESLRGNTHLLGHIHSEASRKKMSVSMRGLKKSEETKARMILSWTPERRAQRAEQTRTRMEANFLKTVAWG